MIPVADIISHYIHYHIVFTWCLPGHINVTPSKLYASINLEYVFFLYPKSYQNNQDLFSKGNIVSLLTCLHGSVSLKTFSSSIFSPRLYTTLLPDNIRFLRPNEQKTTGLPDDWEHTIARGWEINIIKTQEQDS